MCTVLKCSLFILFQKFLTLWQDLYARICILKDSWISFLSITFSLRKILRISYISFLLLFLELFLAKIRFVNRFYSKNKKFLSISVILRNILRIFVNTDPGEQIPVYNNESDYYVLQVAKDCIDNQKHQIKIKAKLDCEGFSGLIGNQLKEACKRDKQGLKRQCCQTCLNAGVNMGNKSK